MSEGRRLLGLLVALSLLVNATVVGGFVVMLASPSATSWLGPKLHLATRAAMTEAQDSADEAAATADDLDSRVADLEALDADSRIQDLETTVGSFCDEFSN